MKAILFDLDGVFYVGDTVIAGARETLAWCDNNAIPYLFITNTTSKPPSAIVDKLQSLAIEVDGDRILSPPVAARDWLQSKDIKTIAAYVVERTRAAFEDFDVVQDPRHAVEAVVVGDLGEHWDFHTLNAAFRHLMHEPQPYLVALGLTRYWRGPDGLRLDAGAYVKALAYASGLEPVVMGKPARAFFDSALRKLGSSAGRTLLVGDDIKSDVGGAQQAGLLGMLVRTGKFQQGDLQGDIEPDAVIDSIADLPSWWETHVDGGTGNA